MELVKHRRPTTRNTNWLISELHTFDFQARTCIAAAKTARLRYKLLAVTVTINSAGTRLQDAEFRVGIFPTLAKNARIAKITYDQASSPEQIEIPLQPSRLARYVSAETTDRCLHFAELTVEGDLANSTGKCGTERRVCGDPPPQKNVLCITP